MEKSCESFWKWGNARKKMAFVKTSSPIKASVIPEMRNLGTGQEHHASNYKDSFVALNMLAAVAACVLEKGYKREDKDTKACGEWEILEPTRTPLVRLVIRRANGALQCVSSEHQPVTVPHVHIPRFKRAGYLSYKYSDFVLH